MPFCRCSKILGEAGKQEILQQMFRNLALAAPGNKTFVVVIIFSCYPSLRASSGLSLTAMTVFYWSILNCVVRRTEAKSFKMSYLAPNLSNLTLKWYNITHPSAFENLVIQTSTRKSSAKHPSKHCSFRQDPINFRTYPRANKNAEIYFGTQLPLRKA